MIEIRTVTRNDYPLILKWLSTKHVKKYWDSDINHTLESLEAKYGPRIDKDVMQMFIAYQDHIPFAFIQTYIEENKEPYLLEEEPMGIDLYIGEKEYLYQGLGPKLINLVLRDIVFQTKGIKYSCIDPDINNEAAIKAYTKVGYKHVNTALNKYSNNIGYFMVLSKKDFFQK